MKRTSIKYTALAGSLAMFLSYAATAQSQNNQSSSSSEQDRIAAIVDSTLLSHTFPTIIRQGSGADKTLFEHIDINYPLNKGIAKYFETVDSTEKAKSFVQLTPYEKNIYLKESIDNMLETIRENQGLL